MVDKQGGGPVRDSGLPLSPKTQRAIDVRMFAVDVVMKSRGNGFINTQSIIETADKIADFILSGEPEKESPPVDVHLYHDMANALYRISAIVGDMSQYQGELDVYTTDDVKAIRSEIQGVSGFITREPQETVSTWEYRAAKEFETMFNRKPPSV